MCTLYAFRTFVAEKRTVGFLGALNFFFFYLTTAVAYWLIVYDTCKNHRIQNAFWQRFNRINDALSVQIDLNEWDFFGAFIAICIVDLILFVLTIVRTLNNSSEYVFHYNFIIIFDQRMFFYLLYLNAVILQMRRILNQIKCQPKMRSSIFEYYRLIYEMIDNMNEAFGWSNLALILYNFQATITFASFLYRISHRKFIAFNLGLDLIFSSDKCFACYFNFNAH